MLALTNLILHDIEIPNIIYDDALKRDFKHIKKKIKLIVFGKSLWWSCKPMVWRQIFLQTLELKRADLF